MAYAGTTSTSPNAPRLISKAMGSTSGAYGTALWQYASTHVQSDVSSTGFFTDGQDLGMELGDIVMVIGSTTTDNGLGPLSMHVVNVVTSTGVGLTTGLMVSSAS